MVIDPNIAMQGAAFPTDGGIDGSVVLIPEPVGWIGVASLAMLARRRRRFT